MEVMFAQWVCRLESEGHTEFRSIISKLVARVDMPMLDGIANNAQACTNVMNLFGMYGSHCLLTFLLVVGQGESVELMSYCAG